jgi:hypothetical protein
MEEQIAEANTVVDEVIEQGAEDLYSEPLTTPDSGTEYNDSLSVDSANQTLFQGFEDEVPERAVESETSHINWQGESKKWQSMYDRSQSRLDKLENAMGNMLEMQANTANKNTVAPNQSERIQISEEEFNPWDAYYKPNSKSYQFRAEQEKSTVDAAVQGHLQKMNESITLNNTVNELKNNHRMEDAEIREFLEFVTQPKEAVGLNNLVKLWRDASGQTSNVSAQNSLQAVKAAKGAPRSPGALPGKQPIRKKEADVAWEKIMGSGATGSRIP